MATNPSTAATSSSSSSSSSSRQDRAFPYETCDERRKRKNREKSQNYRNRLRENPEKYKQKCEEESARKKQKCHDMKFNKPKEYEEKVLAPRRKLHQEQAEKALKKVHKLDAPNLTKHKSEIMDVILKSRAWEFGSFNPFRDQKRARYLLDKMIEMNSRPNFEVQSGTQLDLENEWSIQSEDDHDLGRQTTNPSCFVVFSNPIKKPKVAGVCLVSPAIILTTQQDEQVQSIMPRKAAYINYLAVTPRHDKNNHERHHRLLGEALNDLRKSDVDYVFVCSTEECKEVYTGHGFKKVGLESSGVFMNHPFDLCEEAKMSFMMLTLTKNDFEAGTEYSLVVDKEAMNEKDSKSNTRDSSPCPAADDNDDEGGGGGVVDTRQSSPRRCIIM